MSENVSAEAVEHYPASVGSVMGETYTGYYVVCSCQANEYGDGPRIPAREYPAHLAAHQPARVAPSAEEVDLCEASRPAWEAAHKRYPDESFGGDPSMQSLSLVAFTEGYAAGVASRPTVAEVREQVARELEALLPTDDELDTLVRCGDLTAEYAIGYQDGRRNAAQAVRGETKGGE